VFRGSFFLVCFVPFLFKIIPFRFAHFSLQPSHFLPCLSTVGQAKADPSVVKMFFGVGAFAPFCGSLTASIICVHQRHLRSKIMFLGNMTFPPFSASLIPA
jgi:hypothetical protein